MSVNKEQTDKNNLKENNENERNVKFIVNNKCNTDQALYSIFHTLMAFVAVYLSFRCNNNKFNSASFIFALLCPYIYIIYILATQGTCSK
jgi:hypothetical protein